MCNLSNFGTKSFTNHFFILNGYLLGIVPEINADNESVTEADPCWNLDVTFIKSTSLSYGPWADRQRYMHAF